MSRRTITNFRPSQLIRVALKDLERAEASPHYSVSMGIWHEPEWATNFDADDICQVCLAGSMIAFSLEGNRSDDIVPGDFGAEIQDRLLALDCFRRGKIRAGLIHMQVLRDEQESPVTDVCAVMPYETDPTAFKDDMAWIADALEGAGL